MSWIWLINLLLLFRSQMFGYREEEDRSRPVLFVMEVEELIVIIVMAEVTYISLFLPIL